MEAMRAAWAHTWLRLRCRHAAMGQVKVFLLLPFRPICHGQPSPAPLHHGGGFEEGLFRTAMKQKEQTCYLGKRRWKKSRGQPRGEKQGQQWVQVLKVRGQWV